MNVNKRNRTETTGNKRFRLILNGNNPKNLFPFEFNEHALNGKM